MVQKGKLGIIAGEGLIPAIAANEAKKRGKDVIFIPISPKISVPVNLAFKTRYIPPTKVSQIIKALTEFGASEVLIIGKIPKQVLYSGRLRDFDLRTLWLLRKLKNRNDYSIFRAIAEEFRRHDIVVTAQTKYLENLINYSGVLTKRRPDPKEMEDVEFGLAYAKEIARLDIGQTVVVKRKAVLAVEAIEGTNETISRAGDFTDGKNGVVCKVEKPLQDIRFDIPTVGMDTLLNMAKSGCSVLAIEERKTFIVNAEQVIAYADRHDISIIATKAPAIHSLMDLPGFSRERGKTLIERKRPDEYD
jgi:hypothetical protein